jgi:hypothetical protein
MLKPYTIPPKLTPNQFAKAIVKRPKRILASNGKLRKDGIYNITMPAAKASVIIGGKLQELTTCPSAGACLNVCYASSGTYLFNKAMVKHSANLQFLLDDPWEFASQLVDEIKKIRNLRAIRWNDSGDVFSEGYWGVMKAVMNTLHNVQFYAYTKMVRFFKGRNDIPSNFTLIYSFGGKDDALIDTATDRHSQIFSSRTALRNAGYSDGTHTDRLAANPKYQKIGLVVHGNWLALHKLRRIAKTMEATQKRLKVA